MKETIGIDAISYYVPPIYLPISALANARNIEYAKLNKGLGLQHMALCDVDEDSASMAAQAALKLITDFNIDPKTIGRIYVGTESALDAAKPIATYIMQVLEIAFSEKYGARSMKNCDALDMTFACVGAVDAMLTCIDWVAAGEDRVALVIATDLAKYELNSTGEYTQGAGAVALTITKNPRLLSLSKEVGVATEAVGDFFKPRRHFTKSNLLQEAAQLLGTSLSADDAANLLANNESAFWGDGNVGLEVHMDEPVFDGPYSNSCYQNRIYEALDHFTTQKGDVDVLEDWQHLVFHLPYAFQGRRMLTDQWVHWMLESEEQHNLLDQLEMDEAPNHESEEWAGFVKLASKTKLYKTFVEERIAPGERASSDIGNMYTASIFMSLLSMLRAAYDNEQELNGDTIGFFAYGSGSKSKVFTGTILPNWGKVVAKSDVFNELEKRTAITFGQYEQLHKGALRKPLVANKKVSLERIGDTGAEKGYRIYKTV